MRSVPSLAERAAGRWRRAFPIAAWLPAYERRWLRADVLAGATLAAFVIPESMAYASLAGLPPQAGLYCVLLASAAYPLFGTSRRLALGPTSAISLVVGSTLAPIAGGDLARHATLAMGAALLVAAVGLVAWSLSLGQIVHFVSETILRGFKAGAALVIASTQLAHLAGIEPGGSDFYTRMLHLLVHRGAVHGPSLAVGLAGFAALLAGGRWLPRLPMPLLVVAVAIVASTLLGLPERGVQVVGAIPSGLPPLGVPHVAASDVRSLVPLALACFLLAYVESVSTARALGMARGETIDANQELLAIGAANLAAGLGHGYPVSGGMSQSAVNDRAGARTPLSLGVAALAIAGVLLFATQLFAELPEPILAALVLAAVLHLIDVREFRRLRQVSRMEFHVAMVALVAVLLLGILQGVLIAAIFSIAMLLRRAAAPPVALLGRIPGTDQFADAERHPENERIPGALLLRPGASLVYFNADFVHEAVLARLAAETVPVDRVVLDLSAVPSVDLAGTSMLAALYDELAERRVALRLAEAHGPVRDSLRAAGAAERFAPIDQGMSIETALAMPATAPRRTP